MKVNDLIIISELFDVPVTYFFEDDSNIVSEGREIYKTKNEYQKEIEYLREQNRKLNGQIEFLQKQIEKT